MGFLDANLFDWYPLFLTAEALYRLDRTDEYAPSASSPDPAIERRTKVQ